MNKYGKKVLQTLAIGGTITAGLALNSNNAMAAELEEAEVSVEVGEEAAEAEEGQTQDEAIQAMEDATEVIEGDAVAEAGYVEQAKEVIANDEMTFEKAAEVANNGLSVYNQAIKKSEEVNSIYEVVETRTEEAKAEFYEQAEANGHAEYVEKCEAAGSTEEKLEVVTEAQKKIDAEYDEFNKTQGKDSDEYKNLVADVEAAEEAVSEANNAYENAEENYNNVVAEKNEISDKYEGLEETASELGMKVADLSQDDFDAEIDVTHSTSWVETCKGEVSRIEEDIASKNDEIEKSEALQAEYKAALEKEEDETVRANYDAEVERYNSLKEELVNLELRKNYADTEAANAEADYESYCSKYERIHKELEDAKATYASWKAEVEYDKWSDAYNEIDASVDEALIKLTSAKTTLASKNIALSEVKEKVETVDNKINVYVALVKSVADYKNELQNLSKAEELKVAAEAGLANTESGYKELNILVGNEVIRQMEAAATVTEEDAQVINQCIAQVKEAVSNGTLTEEKAADFINTAKTVLEQAQNKNAELKSINKMVVSQTAEYENNFYEQFNGNGYSEAAEKVKKAKGDEKKIEAIDVVVAEIDAAYEEFAKSQGEDSEEYKALVAAVDATEDSYKDAEESYNNNKSKYESDKKAIDTYDELSTIYKKCYEGQLESLESNVDTKQYYYEVMKGQLDILNEYREKKAEEATQLKTEMEEIQKSIDEMKALYDVDNGDHFDEYYELIEKYTEIENQYDWCESDIESYDYKIESVKDSYDSAKEEYETALQEYSSKQEEVDQWKTSVYYDDIEKVALAAEEGFDNLEATVKTAFATMNEKAAELTALNLKKENADSVIKSTKEAYANFSKAAKDYKESLEYSITVQSIVDRAEAGVKSSSEAYDELQKFVSSSQETPAESVAIVSKNINKKIRNFFNGYDADFQGTISIKANADNKNATCVADIVVYVYDGNKLVDTYIDKVELPAKSVNGKWMLYYGEDVYSYDEVINWV